MKASVGALLMQLWQQRAVTLLFRVYAIYLVVCILVVLPLLNWGAGAIYQQQIGRILHYDLIHFNPFTLAITARNIQDNNSDGNPLWSARRIHIDLSLLQTMIHFAPTLDEVELDGLWLHPQKLANHTWNFDDIRQYRAAQAAANPTPAPVTDESELPALIINHTRVTIESLQFTDSTSAEPFHTSLDNIQFELQNFSTLADENQPYQLQAAMGDGGELIWKGNLSIKGARSQGELALNNINLQPVWKYFKSQLNFTLQKAHLNLEGQYQLRWKKDLIWSLEQGQLVMANSKLRSGKASARDVEMSLGELKLSGISAASQTQQLAVADVQVNGLQLSSWSQGGNTGLARAFILKSMAGDAPAVDASNTPWVVMVNKFALNDAAVDWRAGDLDQHLFKARQLNLTAANIDTSGASAMTIQLATSIDESAQLDLAGEFNLASRDGQFATELTALPAAIAQPLLTPYVRVDIVNGQLHTKADVQVRDATPTQIKSSGSITDIKLRPTAAAQELLTWSSLKWSDAQLDLTTQQVEVPLLELSGFDSRFVITKEGKTNLQALFPEPPNTTATPDVAAQNGSIHSSIDSLTRAREPAAPWHFNLHKFVLDKASFRFNDETLTPNFTAAVQNFSGTMTGLSSDTSKPALFKFHGDVDGYAPVNLQGKTQPFLTQPLLDARLDFENLDLGGFSGYSSTYAGWRIERGLLTANLHYRLNKGLIQGDNHIEMDQLQLGERVDDAKAMDVPLRLALALLTDENGLATLDIGVRGNQNDPGFDIGKVIRQAVRNSLVKIVKSPFTLLAKLVGSKEDLGYLPFNSGSSQLLTTATRKLNALQQALKKRPELRIELRGSYDQNTDLRGLRLAQVKQVLLEEHGLENKDIKAQNERWQKAVLAEYRKLGLKSDTGLNPVQVHEQWLQTVVIAPEALIQLAAQRSINAKQFLVQQLKVDNSRVLINSNLDCSQADACGRRIVKLDLSDLNQTLSTATDR
ncbi:DUF748 domain-containing protein [Cellvibrio fibrivorans]|uniref:DUF748 domain-containing protein n=1 Tax=Cellvibrio fibrivorans TaxID=126350 RepID=A0ABU1UZB0_9GAMM|nr:DUF748 domain-containing protein [Cellvibrio fibrivorans]MDR7090539.1 hypothetical protein [Cellvibrio fibrivorans]